MYVYRKLPVLVRFKRRSLRRRLRAVVPRPNSKARGHKETPHPEIRLNEFDKCSLQRISLVVCVYLVSAYI